VRQCLHAARTSDGLKWIALASIAFQLVLPFRHYWSPYAKSLLGPMGPTIVWIPIMAGFAGGAWLVRRFGRASQHAHHIPLALGCVGLGISSVANLPGLCLPAAALMLNELGTGAFEPMMETFIQNRVASSYRATYGSFHSFLTRLGSVAVLAIVSWWTVGQAWDNALISHVWTISGGALALVAVVLWLRRPATPQA